MANATCAAATRVNNVIDLFIKCGVHLAVGEALWQKVARQEYARVARLDDARRHLPRQLQR